MTKTLNAKIPYMKAWYDRRRAIELVYGVSVTDLVDLLTYVEAFGQLSNISLYLKHPCRMECFLNSSSNLRICQTQITQRPPAAYCFYT